MQLQNWKSHKNPVSLDFQEQTQTKIFMGPSHEKFMSADTWWL